MRLRNIPRADDTLQAHFTVIKNPKEFRGNWTSVFGNDRPIRIEIGMGKGRFLLNMAKTYPNINFIGIERYSSVLLRAVEKFDTEEFSDLPNIRFVCMDARELPEVFAESEVDRIYLNFSDPWPKDRHAKRRLTSSRFLGLYDQILADGGIVEFKTDNQPLFDFSLESVKESGWTLLMQTRDLHHSEFAEGNVMTEYEEKFSSMGNPICKLIARCEE
jgi:tRNA (guanine-N7-)-methyltransferase